MRQAGMTAEAYLLDAREHIDKHFGDGFAAECPELVGAYIRTCAQDFHTCMMAQIAEGFVEAVDGAGELWLAMVKDKLGHDPRGI
jgi:hypothetical protein